MSAAPTNPAVLSRLYLEAVLPCLSELVAEDPTARGLIAELTASILFKILGGRALTIRLQQGQITCGHDDAHLPSVVLLFLSDSHLNAFFAGNKWAVPVLIWGGWRIRLLARFTRLAERLEAVLDGDEAILQSAPGRRLHARLSLMAAGLGLPSLAWGDAASQEVLCSLPYGLASFTIRGEQRATVWFERQATGCAAAWGEPPRRPEVCIAFSDSETAFAAMRDQMDAMAAAGRGQIVVDGLVPLADGLNFVMQRMRPYLQPKNP
jgi:hypothetical protein